MTYWRPEFAVQEKTILCSTASVCSTIAAGRSCSTVHFAPFAKRCRSTAEDISLERIPDNAPLASAQSGLHCPHPARIPVFHQQLLLLRATQTHSFKHDMRKTFMSGIEYEDIACGHQSNRLFFAFLPGEIDAVDQIVEIRTRFSRRPRSGPSPTITRPTLHIR